MMNKLAKIYSVLFGIIYLTAFLVVVLIYKLNLTDLLTTFLFVGAAFSFLAWLLTRNTEPTYVNRPAQKNEGFILILLIIWIVLYITWGGDFINSLLPKNMQHNEQWQFFVIIARKLFVFVLIPYFVYCAFGFSLQDFGLKISNSKTFSKSNVLLLIVMSAAILLFEYFCSGGAEPLRKGQFTSTQLLIAIPATFVWLFIEAGLIEEFFFRGILQSRLAVLLQSDRGAILIGGLIFGLVHVPGLYIRGAGSEGVSEQLPVWFWLSYCIVNMSIAGIFLGIVWSKTKNLYLVIILHTMIDLLPNLDDFIHSWKI